MTVYKVVVKIRLENGQYKKEYKKQPKTSLRRLLESPDISQESKAELGKRRSSLNPTVYNTSGILRRKCLI